jgi:hypothetical protein
MKMFSNITHIPLYTNQNEIKQKKFLSLHIM